MAGGSRDTAVSLSPSDLAYLVEQYCLTPIDGTFTLRNSTTVVKKIAPVGDSMGVPTCEPTSTATAATEPRRKDAKRAKLVKTLPETIFRERTSEHYKWIKEKSLLDKAQVAAPCTKWTTDAAKDHVVFTTPNGGNWLTHHYAFQTVFLPGLDGSRGETIREYYSAISRNEDIADWEPTSAEWWNACFARNAASDVRAYIERTVAARKALQEPTDRQWFDAAFGPESTAPEDVKERYAHMLRSVPFEEEGELWWQQYFNDATKFEHVSKKQKVRQAKNE